MPQRRPGSTGSRTYHVDGAPHDTCRMRPAGACRCYCGGCEDTRRRRTERDERDERKARLAGMTNEDHGTPTSEHISPTHGLLRWRGHNISKMGNSLWRVVEHDAFGDRHAQPWLARAEIARCHAERFHGCAVAREAPAADASPFARFDDSGDDDIKDGGIGVPGYGAARDHRAMP